MLIKNFPFLFLSLFLLIFSSFLKVETAKEIPQERDYLKQSQQIMMAFVCKFSSPSSPKFLKNLSKFALGKIFDLYQRIGNREVTLSFYTSLLNSKQYKTLYPYLFYYTSNFFGKHQKKKYLLKSLKSSENERDRQFALTHLYLYYKNEGIRYLELSYLLQLIEIQKNNRDFTGLELSKLALGEIYQKKGDYLTALNSYFQALNYSQKVKQNNRGTIYLNISEVFRILNRKELAKMYIKNTLDYAEKYGDKILEVKALNTFSKLYYEEEDYNDALMLINLALEKEKKNRQYICEISSLYQKARILIKMENAKAKRSPTAGPPPTAMILLKNAVDLGLKRKKYENLLPILSEYIEILISRGQFSEAKVYLEIIDDIYAPFYTYYFFYDYLKALYFQKQNRINLALQFYQKTITNLEQFYSNLKEQQYHLYTHKIADIYAGIIEFYLEMYNRTENLLYIKKALYFSEIKNSYIYEFSTMKNNSHNYLKEEKAKLEQRLLEWNKKYLELLKNDNPQDHQKELWYENQLETIKRQKEELMAFILDCPISYKKYSFKDFDLTAIQKRLNASQLIVKFAVLKENIYIFCIDYRSTSYWKLEGNTRSIIDKIRQLTGPLDDFTSGNVDYLRINYDLNLAHRLYKILMKDIWAFRSNVDELFIIPDDELFKLPFEALVTGFNQKEMKPDIIYSEYNSANYLIEKIPVSYSFSLFHFREKRKIFKHKKYFLAAFGNPVILKLDEKSKEYREKGRYHMLSNNRKVDFFKELPSTGKEIAAITSIVKGQSTKIFIGKEFNRKNFETYAPQANIVHIATHFINNLHFPQYSALLFSPSKKSSPFYFAHEIFKLPLNNDLVVLSACESSEKHLLGLQGLRGMTASFKHSGTRAILVSMWPIDEHSSELNSYFYSEYRNNPQVSLIPTALRKAKLNLMNHIVPLEKGLKISYAHPFLWANYILYWFR